MFNISSMIIVLHLFLFQTKIPCQCLTYHLWSLFFMFLSYRDKNRVLKFDRWSIISILYICVFQTFYRVLNVWYIIYMFDISSYHRFSCLYIPDINEMSVMFNISSMIIILHVSVFQRYIPCPFCSSVTIVLHIIYDHRSPCLCIREINFLSLMFNISSLIIVIYVCVLQR